MIQIIGEIIACITIVGGAYVLCRLWLEMMRVQHVIKELDREIAADNLKCAQEERRAAALRVIRMNEQEANREH